MCLQLGKLQVLTEVFEWYAEVLGLHGCGHQLHIIDSVLGCLAKILQEVRLIHILEGLGHTIGGFCHLQATINKFFDGIFETLCVTTKEFCCLGHHVTI